ncbi:recombinase family protein [Streptomyces sp. NPDC057540]|uniref:recombinase family protein n=1 Tax=Streptomyces sp. NPDC057540 TaxID=3346160 RepID=UPI003680876E
MRAHQPPLAADDEPWLGYIRVSTWREEKISPELQEQSLRDWARRTGRRLIEPLITDLDVSGRHFKRKITGAIERVEAGEARGVAVWRYSRFGRDRTGNALWLARLERAGGQLESATEQIDATTAVGRFQRGMILEFGAFESDRAGEQWRETHRYRRYELGLPAQGRKRAGYIWHPRRVPDADAPGGLRLQTEWYQIDDEYGPAVASLYREYVDGTGFSALAIHLNEHGWRTTQDTLWTTETLSRYMDSGFPAGLLTVHDPGCRCGRTNGNCRRHIKIQGKWEELVDWDLWEAYQKRRQEVRDTAPRSRVGLYELTSLVKCAQCRLGTALTTQKNTRGPSKPGHAYRCSSRAKAGPLACVGVYIRRDLVEAEVLAWMGREAARGIMDASPTEQHDDQAERAAREQAQRVRARTRAQAEVEKTRKAIARLRADYNENPGEYGPGEYDDALAELRGRRATAEKILAETPEPQEEVTPLRADYVPVLRDLVAEWEAYNTAEKNAAYRKILRRVALVRHDKGSAGVEIQIHPTFEPDPWAKPRQ